MRIIMYTINVRLRCEKMVDFDMSSTPANDSGFSESEIHFARQAFIRDCPDGRCSERRFLAFIRQSSAHKPHQAKLPLFRTLKNYRQRKKFFSTMFNIYDRNHDGELDFDEYLYALSAITGANRLRTVETLFSFFDIDNQGFITREQFNSRKKVAAQFLGQSKTGLRDQLLVDRAFNAMDTNRDGRITKEEFIRWHLKEHETSEKAKPEKRRTRLFRNLSTFVEIRGQLKTSSLQQSDAKNPVSTWLETPVLSTPNGEHLPLSPRHVDRYLANIFRRARDRIHHGKQNPIDRKSESGVFTSSSTTTFPDNDFDIGDDDLPTDDMDNELLCQSLEAALGEVICELRQHRQQHTSTGHEELSIYTRL